MRRAPKRAAIAPGLLATLVPALPGGPGRRRCMREVRTENREAPGPRRGESVIPGQFPAGRGLGLPDENRGGGIRLPKSDKPGIAPRPNFQSRQSRGTGPGSRAGTPVTLGGLFASAAAIAHWQTPSFKRPIASHGSLSRRLAIVSNPSIHSLVVHRPAFSNTDHVYHRISRL
jgi:hypothetical protein